MLLVRVIQSSTKPFVVEKVPGNLIVSVLGILETLAQLVMESEEVRWRPYSPKESFHKFRLSILSSNAS